MERLIAKIARLTGVVVQLNASVDQMTSAVSDYNPTTYIGDVAVVLS